MVGPVSLLLLLLVAACNVNWDVLCAKYPYENRFKGFLFITSFYVFFAKFFFFFFCFCVVWFLRHFPAGFSSVKSVCLSAVIFGGLKLHQQLGTVVFSEQLSIFLNFRNFLTKMCRNARVTWISSRMRNFIVLTVTRIIEIEMTTISCRYFFWSVFDRKIHSFVSSGAKGEEIKTFFN